jgi:hypothetical protein
MPTASITIAAPISRPSAKKSFLKRLYDAFVEARQRAAMRELAMHRHLIPEDVAKNLGFKSSLSNDATMPFVR